MHFNNRIHGIEAIEVSSSRNWQSAIFSVRPLVRGNQHIRNSLSRSYRVHRRQLGETTQRGQERAQLVTFRHARQRVLGARFNSFNGIVAKHARHVDVACRRIFTLRCRSLLRAQTC